MHMTIKRGVLAPLALGIVVFVACAVNSTSAQGDSESPVMLPWRIVDTSTGVIRINQQTGESFLLTVEDPREPEWIRIKTRGALDDAGGSSRITTTELLAMEYAVIYAADMKTILGISPRAKVPESSVIKKGDIMTSAGGVPITSKSNLESAIRNAKDSKSTKIEITLTRQVPNGTDETLTVRADVK